MTTKGEALALALKALEKCVEVMNKAADRVVKDALVANALYAQAELITDAITAIKQAQQAQEPVNYEDRATIAGLEASIGHLSSLVNQQLLLLEEVDINLGVDGMGVPLDDDQSPTIAKVREHLAAMAPPEPAPKQAEPEGYKLVPVEPTQEMHDAGRKALSGGSVPMNKVYSAMLAAAPTPPEAK